MIDLWYFHEKREEGMEGRRSERGLHIKWMMGLHLVLGIKYFPPFGTLVSSPGFSKAG